MSDDRIDDLEAKLKETSENLMSLAESVNTLAEAITSLARSYKLTIDSKVSKENIQKVVAHWEKTNNRLR